ISLRLARQDEGTLKMLEFFTKYWVENRDILLDGQFTSAKPLSNYPYLSSSKGKKCIIGLYEDVPLHLGANFEEIDILNGKMSQTVILFGEGLGEWQASIVDIFGEEVNRKSLHFPSGLERIECPPNGIIQLTKKKDS
ncbi:MAG: hypothetical protein AAGC85_24755, partial [Bacteroidota bacterium]